MKTVNYHTHTSFCDGKNTPEELVLAAIDKGLCEIGFSGHSYVKEQGFGMTASALEEYKAQINFLKKKYKGKIKIYLGIEMDYYSDIDTSDFDFILGSVHVIMRGNACLEVDLSQKAFISDVNEYFGGDYFKYAEEYYKLVGDLYNKTRCDIIGHFDLVTKFNENNGLFDTNDERYKAAADRALDRLLNTDAVFEINTGAVSRGYRSTPYPDERIIKRIGENGGGFTVSSDCHAAENIDFLIKENIDALEAEHFKCYTSMDEILRTTRENKPKM